MLIVQVMADVYASAVGLMVLQMKEIPPRPPEFDGKVCLFSLKEGVDEEKIRSVLKRFGTVVECDMNRDPVVVTFASHEEALSAVQAGAPDLCDGIDTQYNERSYDGRAGEVDRRDDDGRGWCAPPLLFHIAPSPIHFPSGGGYGCSHHHQCGQIPTHDPQLTKVKTEWMTRLPSICCTLHCGFYIGVMPRFCCVLCRCCLEGGVSFELPVRLVGFPRMKQVLDLLPP